MDGRKVAMKEMRLILSMKMKFFINNWIPLKLVCLAGVFFLAAGIKFIKTIIFNINNIMIFN